MDIIFFVRRFIMQKHFVMKQIIYPVRKFELLQLIEYWHNQKRLKR